MKKLFFLRGIQVIVSTLLLYSLIIFLYFRFQPTTGSNKLNSWLPNALSTSGGSGYTLLRLTEAETASDVDILFIGSSQVFRGFDVRIFQQHGLKAFNLGTSAQTLFNSYYLMKEYLPTLKPEYVVLDVYWGVAKNDGVEPTIDILSNSDLDASTLEMVFDLKNGTVFGSLFAACINRIHTPLQKIPQKKFRDLKYIPGGFAESLTMHNRYDAATLEQVDTFSATLTDFQEQYLKKIIALCKEHNKELILVLTPVTKEYKGKVTNYRSYASKIKKLSQENGIPFLDYNERQDLSLESAIDFTDTNHLAQSGAEKFNHLFIRDLKALGVTARTDKNE